MQQEIYQSLFGEHVLPSVALAGTPAFGAVSALAIEALTASVMATQRLDSEINGSSPEACVDQTLVDLWCHHSFVPDGWALPPQWDDFSGDYETRDGWIRLHCNADHHRNAARKVLGDPADKTAAAQATKTWTANDLETEVVTAGGCAAELRTSQDWRAHPQGQALSTEPVVDWKQSPSAACKWQPSRGTAPLQGLRVLDLTRIIAGPVATRFLASLGADVLRIDPPNWTEGGNEIEMSLGKTCAELDLKSNTGRVTFERLVESADILVHGYRKDALSALGFDHTTLTRLNPSLLTVSLTAYGWTGPWANRRGFDSLVQRSSGLAVKHNGKTLDLPYQVLDHATGYLMAAAGIEALLRQITTHTVSHPRLSLARQSLLLLNQGVTADLYAENRAPDPSTFLFKSQPETTPWGNGHRLPLPFEIAGITPSWRTPAHRLRSDPPQWAQKRVNP